MITGSLDGLTEAKAALSQLPEAFRETVAHTIELGVAIIEGEADARVPEESGALRASIGKAIRGDGLQATVGAGEHYARYVEFGTIHRSARPFLWPAFRLGARFVRKQMRQWGEDVGRKIRTRTKRSKLLKK